MCLFNFGGGGVPHPRSGWGVPHNRSGRGGGYPIPGLGRGVPHPRSGQGGYSRYPQPGLDGGGYPQPGLDGVLPTPIRQSSTANTCCPAGGMPLAFMQEDFLVELYFFSIEVLQRIVMETDSQVTFLKTCSEHNSYNLIHK